MGIDNQDSDTQDATALPATGNTKSDAVWLVVGIASLGSLIGIICGLSSAAVTLPLMAALFSLAGGGITSIVSGLKERDAKMIAGKLLFSFCITCTLFLLLGIWAREHHWLTPPGEKKEEAPILKSATASDLQLVTGMCVNGQYGALADFIKGK